MGETITHLSIDRIEVEAGHNHRTKFDPTELRQLADNIEAYGLAQPPTVRPHGEVFYLVAGERRLRAIQLLGWTEVPVIIRDLDDTSAYAVMLAENLSRSDPDAIDEAQGYAEGIAKGLSVEEIAKMAGVKVTRVRWRLDLLKLDPDMRHFTSTGALPLGFAWEMRNLDVNRQRLAFRALTENADLPLAAFKELCARLEAEQNQDGFGFGDGDFFQMEEYVIEATDAANARRPGKKALAGLLAKIADELAAHDPNNHLIAIARQAAEAATAA